MTTPLQCQVEAARFATRVPVIDEVRRRVTAEACDLIVNGDRDAALEVMLAGLHEQCPLTFPAPERGAA